eukprot:6160298-Amphidinium_carterae.1
MAQIPGSSDGRRVLQCTTSVNQHSHRISWTGDDLIDVDTGRCHPRHINCETRSIPGISTARQGAFQAHKHPKK